MNKEHLGRKEVVLTNCLLLNAGEKIFSKNKRKLKGPCPLWQTTTEHSKLDTHARCTQVNRLHKAAWVGTVQKRLVLYLPLRYHTWFSGVET